LAIVDLIGEEIEAGASLGGEPGADLLAKPDKGAELVLVDVEVPAGSDDAVVFVDGGLALGDPLADPSCPKEQGGALAERAIVGEAVAAAEDPVALASSIAALGIEEVAGEVLDEAELAGWA
jgi:hypothetical protein